MAEKDVNLQIGGDETDLISALNRAQEAVKASTAQMKTHFESFSNSVQSIQKTFVAFTAVIMGGEALSKITQQAAAWNVEALKMSKQLGISTQEASVFMVAMKHLGIDTSVLTEASSKMSKQLFTHAEAFERLGITTKDATGHFRPAADMIGEVNSKLLAIKNPIERNIEGLQLYGKGWDTIRPLLKLTSDEFNNAKDRAEQLGLVVGPEGAEKAHQYELAMNDLKLVGNSLSVQMGQTLLPVMTSVGVAAAMAAPKIGEILGSALKFVAGIAIDVGVTLGELGTAIGGIMAAAVTALTGDFSGARRIIQEMGNDIDEIGKKGEAMKAKLNAPVTMGKRPDISSGDAGPLTVPKESQLPGFESQLAQVKAKYETEEGFRQFSLQRERDYWQRILDTTTLGANDKLSIKRKIAEAEIGIAKQGFAAEIESLKVQETEYKNNADKKLEIARDVAAKMKAAYGEDSKEYQSAANHIVEIEREKQNQIRQLQTMHSDVLRKQQLIAIDMDEETARMAVDMGGATNEELALQEQAFEERRYQIQRAGLEERKGLIDPDHDPVSYAQVCAEIEEIEDAHQLEMQKVKNQTTLAAFSTQQQLQSNLQSGFQQTLTKFVAGSASIAQTMQGLLRNITSSIIQMLTQLMAKKLAMHAAEMLMGKKEMLMAAAQAAVHAAKSAAQIPFVGWALAIGAAAAVYAGLKNLTSASGGYDIPAGQNPVTQLHAREMVLPAKHADVIRAMADGNGGEGGGKNDLHVHFDVSAMDGPSVGSFFSEHSRAIAGAIHQEIGRFNPVFT